MSYQLAEINVARIKGTTIEDPIMKEFVDNLDTINALAENSDGFVWRLKDDSNNATNLNPYNDVQIIINISVWKDVETLSNYVYKTVHTNFLRRRKEWFKNYGEVSTAMWWIPEGKYPTVEEAVEKLAQLQKNGPNKDVFNFKKPFPKPY